MVVVLIRCVRTPQVRMRALQESTHELQGRLDTALAEKAAMHRQWIELRRQLAECTAQNSRLEADTLPPRQVRGQQVMLSLHAIKPFATSSAVSAIALRSPFPGSCSHHQSGLATAHNHVHLRKPRMCAFAGHNARLVRDICIGGAARA